MVEATENSKRISKWMGIESHCNHLKFLLTNLLPLQSFWLIWFYHQCFNIKIIISHMYGIIIHRQMVLGRKKEIFMYDLMWWGAVCLLQRTMKINGIDRFSVHTWTFACSQHPIACPLPPFSFDNQQFRLNENIHIYIHSLPPSLCLCHSHKKKWAQRIIMANRLCSKFNLSISIAICDSQNNYNNNNNDEKNIIRRKLFGSSIPLYNVCITNHGMWNDVCCIAARINRFNPSGSCAFVVCVRTLYIIMYRIDRWWTARTTRYEFANSKKREREKNNVIKTALVRCHSLDREQARGAFTFPLKCQAIVRHVRVFVNMLVSTSIVWTVHSCTFIVIIICFSVLAFISLFSLCLSPFSFFSFFSFAIFVLYIEFMLLKWKSQMNVKTNSFSNLSIAKNNNSNSEMDESVRVCAKMCAGARLRTSMDVYCIVVQLHTNTKHRTQKLQSIHSRKQKASQYVVGCCCCS